MNRGSGLAIFGMSARENSPCRDVVPAPGGGLGHEPGDQRDNASPIGDAQRSARLLVRLCAEPAQELFGMLAVQVGQVGILRMRLDYPGHQATQRVTGVPHGLRPVEVRVQVHAQVTLNDCSDLRRRVGRGDAASFRRDRLQLNRRRRRSDRDRRQ